MQRPVVGLAARWPWDAGFLPVPSGRQVRPRACACIRAGGEQGGGPGGDRSWGHRLGSATAASTPVLRVQWKGRSCCQTSKAGSGGLWGRVWSPAPPIALSLGLCPTGQRAGVRAEPSCLRSGWAATYGLRPFPLSDACSPPFLSAALPLLSVVAKMTTSYVLGCK